MSSTERNIKLAVVIPMYNEAQGAERCVRAVCRVLSLIPGSTLIVVDDGSLDRTAEVVRALQENEPLLGLVTYPANRGYGAATASGIQAALDQGFEYGLFMDSDLTNDPELIPQFLNALEQTGCDVVKASRYIDGGGMLGVPAYRQRYTIVGNRIASFLFRMGVRDCTNAFRLVRLELLRGVTFKERGFAMLLEELLVLKKRGARVTEIPYILTSRAPGEGESKFTYAPRVLWAYLKYALMAAFIVRRAKCE